MRKLILRCGLAPGDIVMLTAAVRDLHRCYPGRFTTDVRTSCPELWENNPFVRSIPDEDSDAELIECTYPLINRCNEIPYHCLHGFIAFLNERLRLYIKPTAFKGDIHLSDQEKAWYSQVRELTGKDIPFWIIAAGGKYDITIKWWQSARYQCVVDHFRGRIQFVQVGEQGHNHPKLNGVIDLRGRTNLRELVRLVYHSEGILCSVTSLMHLAAAVETKPGHPKNRACVVVAGGREPAHWEAYPGHQFIHTNGALPCCIDGGCWRDRTVRLRDGDKRDRFGSLCVDTQNGLPHCMDLITGDEVIRRIELYFKRGMRNYLSPQHWRAAQRGMAACARNRFDRQPLNLHNAGMACDRKTKAIPPCPADFAGRGIVICGGGVRYFTCAWVCINMLRHFGCRLPIEFWYLGGAETDERMIGLLKPLQVECIDASEVRKKFPSRGLGGWELKPYALLHSRFREVLLLDADNVPVIDPTYLFDIAQYKKTGAIFWPDYNRVKGRNAKMIWRSCGLGLPKEKEFETGQILVDKSRCWPALCLTLWFNEHSDFYYRYVHGDKETFHLAFRKLKQPYCIVPKPIHKLQATMCQHDFQGRRVFQHRNRDKWDFLLHNKQIEDFWFEEECRDYIRQLQQVWDGGLGLARLKSGSPRCNGSTRRVKIAAIMISCNEREQVRTVTLQNLARTDWQETPVHIEMDRGKSQDHHRRQTRCAFLALQAALLHRPDYVLFLEDDLDFNRYLCHNLYSWRPLKDRHITLASLYNPRVREIACDLGNRARIVEPASIFGSQGFLISREAVKYVLSRWHSVPGMQDIKISRLAGRLGRPILYHAPSLVEHISTKSVWGGGIHRAMDFDPDWKA